MIYVPDLENYECFVVLDSKTIRAYEEMPVLGELIDYRDYYINSHYIYSDGIELIEKVPVCISEDKLTTESYYRNDLSHILIIFVILAFICFYLPSKLLFRMFRKG